MLRATESCLGRAGRMSGRYPVYFRGRGILENDGGAMLKVRSAELPILRVAEIAGCRRWSVMRKDWERWSTF